MSYIPPQSVVKLYSGIPLDASYENTIYFATRSAQASYFDSHRIFLLDDSQWQRVNKNSMKVHRNANELDGCNYLSFTNYRADTVSPRTYYAFVTEINYINENTTELIYEIDVMQSYLVNYDYVLQQCFVEREHQSTDIAGDNLVPENLQFGDIVINSGSTVSELETRAIIIAHTKGVEEGSVVPRVGATYNGTMSGLQLSVYADTPNGRNSAIEFLRTINLAGFTVGEQCVCIYYAPMHFAPVSTQSDDTRTITKRITKPEMIGSYTPYNKKLLTYPYNYLIVNNMMGKENVYKFEFFDDTDARFQIIGNSMPNPSLYLTPINYKKASNAPEEGLELSGYPQCSWISDEFAAWLAQASISTIGAVIGGVGAGAVGAMATAESATELTEIAFNRGMESGVRALNNVASNILPALTNSISSHGNTPSTLKLKRGLLNYWFYNMQITEDYARRLDGYFNRFGYACHKIKVPNVNVRDKWTFTKTVGCQIDGSVPSDFARKIESIYNKGITYWRYQSGIDNIIGKFVTSTGMVQNNPL